MDKVEQGRAVTNALNQGIQVIIGAGKTNLANRNGVKTGNLKKSFTKKTSRKKNNPAAYAGFKRSTRYNKIGGGNHSYLVDRGTVKRWTRKGAYRGSVSKNNPQTGTMFWTDAVQENGPKAMSKLMDAIYDTLNNMTKK